MTAPGQCERCGSADIELAFFESRHVAAWCCEWCREELTDEDAAEDSEVEAGLLGEGTAFLLALAGGMDWRHLHPEDRGEAARAHLSREASISTRSLALLKAAIGGSK